MIAEFEKQLSQIIEEIKSQGLFKTERIITGPQDAHIAITGGKRVLNMCANNYLGLADHPALIAAAKEALDTHGFGMASVRFICGTQDIHKELEAALTKFLGTEDTILYPSCFDANGGLFETLLTEKDAVISDELNHASIIDGIRLCKAQRLRYRNNDMADLEAKLREASGARVADVPGAVCSCVPRRSARHVRKLASLRGLRAGRAADSTRAPADDGRAVARRDRRARGPARGGQDRRDSDPHADHVALARSAGAQPSPSTWGARDSHVHPYLRR